MTAKRAMISALPLLIGSLVLCGEPAQAQQVENSNTPCKTLLQEYKKQPPPKAFALTHAMTNNPSQYCGAAWGAKTKEAAEAEAKRVCRTKTIGKSANSAVPLPPSCSVVRSE